MKSVEPSEVAFKSSKNDSVLVFVNGEHIGSLHKSENWYNVDLEYSGVVMNTQCLFATGKEQMRDKIAAVINEEVKFKAPFDKIKKASRVTRKDINECIVKIVENANSLSKENIVDLLKGIIL